MSGLRDWNDYDTLEDLENSLNIRNLPSRERHFSKKARPASQAGHAPQDKSAGLNVFSDESDEFNFSYDASRHERVWIIESLEEFLDNGNWLDDVVRLIKGGKEAHVYQCLANSSVPGLLDPGQESSYLAAKIYRPRKFRNLKDDHLYREGRDNLDEQGHPITESRKLHAIEKRTEYGRSLLRTSWIEHEYTTLCLLHAAGANVPRPLTSGSNAILMAYIGDDDTPAPTLSSVRLDRAQARRLLEQVVHNIDLMLGQHRIHADLSAYNILYWAGEISLIDFPQAIDPLQNRSAYPIFERDVARVCEYFASQGVRTDGRKLAASLWRNHRYPRNPEIHPSLLDPESDQDRRLWRERGSPARR